jgi:hypothetical protein
MCSVRPSSRLRLLISSSPCLHLRHSSVLSHLFSTHRLTSLIPCATSTASCSARASIPHPLAFSVTAFSSSIIPRVSHSYWPHKLLAPPCSDRMDHFPAPPTLIHTLGRVLSGTSASRTTRRTPSGHCVGANACLGAQNEGGQALLWSLRARNSPSRQAGVV